MFIIVMKIFVKKDGHNNDDNDNDNDDDDHDDY